MIPVAKLLKFIAKLLKFISCLMSFAKKMTKNPKNINCQADRGLKMMHLGSKAIKQCL